MKNKSPEKEKNKGGRPTKYSKKIVTQTKKYIKDCENSYKQLVKQSNEEKGYVMYENKLEVNLPTIEGLALFLKIHKDTIYSWEKDENKKEFSDVIGELMAKQAKMLMNFGLSGDYNPTIAKVLLAKHGYIEREERKHTGEINVNNLLSKIDPTNDLVKEE